MWTKQWSMSYQNMGFHWLLPSAISHKVHGNKCNIWTIFKRKCISKSWCITSYLLCNITISARPNFTAAGESFFQDIIKHDFSFLPSGPRCNYTRVCWLSVKFTSWREFQMSPFWALLSKNYTCCVCLKSFLS